MITSGLVNTQRARFEKGFPQVRDNNARNVRFEDPFVQTNVYSKLDKSEFVKPLNQEINPTQVFFKSIFGKSTSADERNYLAHQLLQSKKAPRAKSHKMKRNIPEPDLDILETSGESNSVLYDNIVTGGDLGSINVNGTTQTVPLNQDVSIQWVPSMSRRFNRPNAPPTIDTYFHNYDVPDLVTSTGASGTPMVVSSGAAPPTDGSPTPIDPNPFPTDIIRHPEPDTSTPLPQYERVWNPDSPPPPTYDSVMASAVARAETSNGLAPPVSETRRVTTDSNLRPDPRLINFPTPTETFLIPPTSQIGKRRRDSVGGGGGKRKAPVGVAETAIGKRRRDSEGGGGGKRTREAGEEHLGKRRRDSEGGGGGKRTRVNAPIRRQSISGGGLRGTGTQQLRRALRAPPGSLAKMAADVRMANTRRNPPRG